MSGHEVPEWPGGVDVLNSLKDVATFHRPVSASMISRACKTIVGNIREYKHVVHSVEKFLKHIPPEERIPVAYVIDAVVKDSLAKNGDKDPFEGRFALRMKSGTLPLLGEAPSSDRELLYKLVKSWSQRRRFGLSNMDVSHLKEVWAEESPSVLHSPNQALLAKEDEVPPSMHRRVKRPESLRRSSSGGNVITSVRPSPPVPSKMSTFGRTVPSQEVPAAAAASETQPQSDLISLLEMSETSSRSPNDLYSCGQMGDRGFGSWDSREGSRTMGGPTAMHSELDPRNNTHHHQQQQQQPMVLPVEQKDQQQHLWQGDQQQNRKAQQPQGTWPTNEPHWKRDQQQMRPPSTQRQQAWQDHNQQQSPWKANPVLHHHQQQQQPWQQNQHSIHVSPLSSQQQQLQLPPHTQQQQKWEQQKWQKTKVVEQVEEDTGQKMEKSQPSGHKLETDQPKKRQRKSHSRWDQGPVTSASQPPSGSTIETSRAVANASAALSSSSESLHTSPRRICIPPSVPSPPPPSPPHIPCPPRSPKISLSAALPCTRLPPQPTKATSSLPRGFPNRPASSGPPPPIAATSLLQREFPSGVHLGLAPPKTTSSLPRELSGRNVMHLGQQHSTTSLPKGNISSAVGRPSHPLPAGLPVGSSAMASATGLTVGTAQAVLLRGLPIDSNHQPPNVPPRQHQKVGGGEEKIQQNKMIGGQQQQHRTEEIHFPLKNKICRNISKNKPCSYGQNCHFSHTEDEIKAGFRIILGEVCKGGESGGGGGGLPIPIGNNNQGWGHSMVPPFLGLNSVGHPVRAPPPPPPQVLQFHLAQGGLPPPPPIIRVPPEQVTISTGNDQTDGNEVVSNSV